MLEGDVNYVAVLVAAIASMIVGAVWYNPKVFGTQWMQLTNRTPESIDKKEGNKAMAISMVFALVTTYVLARVFQTANVVSFGDAIVTAFWVWLGFMASVIAVHSIFEEKLPKLTVMNASYQLVSLLAAALVLVAWP